MGIEERGIWTDTTAIKESLAAAGVTQVQLEAMVDALQILDNIVSGSEGQVDIVGSLPVGANVIGKVSVDQATPGTTNKVIAGHDKSGIGHGVETVDAVATAQPIAASTPAKVVIIQAQTDNTGAIAVGGAGVLATVATGTGVLLYAGDSITLEVDNLADVYIDATVQDEGVRFAYLS